MRSTKIVTSFVTKDNKFLILRRSDKAKSMKGLWSAVSGVIEEGEDPLERAKIELYEEIGAKRDSIRLLKSGRKMIVSSPQYLEQQWVVFPFLFETSHDQVLLNWENDSYRWITPDEIYQYKTVPSLDKVLLGLL
jgi:8-oxo-dGTP pyrophosphatase MutT (NUDIX family)